MKQVVITAGDGLNGVVRLENRDFFDVGLPALLLKDRDQGDDERDEADQSQYAADQVGSPAYMIK